MPRKTKTWPPRTRARSGFNEAAARCRGKPAGPLCQTSRARGFNEAAARCRGKLPRRRSWASRSRARFNEAAARCRGKLAHLLWRQGHLRASMRPRPDAAENIQCGSAVVGGAAASMRPRPDAAENATLTSGVLAYARASMRPRPDAAENRRSTPPDGDPRPGFNEAAARCRGKLGCKATCAWPPWLLQ